MTTPTKYRLISSAGQITAVVTDSVSVVLQATIAQSIMTDDCRVEQVGFLSGTNFRMMGGELSINALLAAAFLLNESGQVNEYSFTTNQSTITLSLPTSLIISVQDNLVKLRGINYQIVEGIPSSTVISPPIKTRLRKLAADSLAAGLIYYQGSVIKPLVYVPATSSYVWENACGSGSLAFSLVTSIRQVTQPSGQNISFDITNSQINVTTTVKEV